MVEGARREQGLSRGCQSCLLGAVGMRLLVLARTALAEWVRGGMNQTCSNTIPVRRSERSLWWQGCRRELSV